MSRGWFRGEAASQFRYGTSVSHAALMVAVFYASAAPALAQEAGAPVETMVVTDRLPPAASDAIFSGIKLGREDMAMAPQLRIDDVLGQVPSFSLFRRTSSLIAHPTTQGATLRGIGPNGAGRALVLVDGVPQNDPFGGWVYWARIAPEVVDDVDVVEGGGVGPYANSALSGTVRINTRIADAPSVFFKGSYGDKDTLDATGGVTIPVGDAHVFARGGYDRTDGVYVLKKADRGDVDRPVDSRMGWGEAGAQMALGTDTNVTLKAAYFGEDRGNGSPLAYNGTDGYDLSAGIVSYEAGNGAGWEAHLFYQHRNFDSQFSSVADDRNSESPALQQFDVPGKSLGANVIAHLPVGDELRLQIGADARTLKGSTGERFLWSGTDFERQRRAGGKQLLAGTFAEATWMPDDTVTATLGVRGDYWEMTDGSRVEFERATGNVLLDETFDDRHDTVLNARAGIEYRPLPPYTVHLAGYTGYRVPTINELYRPYRVRNDITEANPGLVPERLYGAEAGIAASPLQSIKASLTFFVDRVRNAVANVQLTDEPGIYTPLGVFVPAGGTLSQRLNLDRTLTKGIEATGRLTLFTGWRVEASYLYVDSKVKRADVDPGLEGKVLPQVPRNQATLSLVGAPVAHWHGRVDLKLSDSAFDDQTNTNKLNDYATVDAYLGFNPRQGVEIFGRIQNLFDADIETANSDGLISYGQPRLWQAGVSVEF